VRAGTLSFGALSTLGLAREESAPAEESKRDAPQAVRRWDAEAFAREQVQGLVRRVFFKSGTRAVKQLMLCGADLETDVGGICYEVGDALARETMGDVALVGDFCCDFSKPDPEYGKNPSVSLKALQKISTRLRTNLWLVPACGIADEDSISGSRAYLGEIRREFEYSIVQATCGSPSESTHALAANVDGVVLVLSAQRTRRTAARHLKDLLENAGAALLGTILMDRDFPMPEGIYRRL